MINILEYPIEKKRDEFYDALKGFAIFTMVLGHVITWFWAGRENDAFKENIYFNIIYSFHMFLLFFISGIFFPKENGYGYRKGIKVIWKRIQTLLIPFVSGGFLYYFFRGTDVTVLWFLRSLFVFFTINLFLEVFRYYIVSNLIIDIIYYMTMAFALFKLPEAITGGHPIHYIMYSIGILIKRYKMEGYINSLRVFDISLILFLVFNVLRQKYPNFHLPTPLFVLCPLAGSCVFYYIFKNIFSKGQIYEFFKLLGFYSLEIYIIHGLFIYKIPQIGMFIDTLYGFKDDFITRSNIGLFMAFVISIIVIFMSMLLIRVVETSKVLKYFLFGKK